MGYMILPLSAFFIFVAPLWLILHYRSQKQTTKGLSIEQQNNLKKLLLRTEELQQRIVSLQAILDEEAPQWRQKSNEK